MLLRLVTYLSTALCIVAPSAAWAGSISGKIQAIGAEAVEDEAYLMVTVKSCHRASGLCRAQVLACLLDSPFARLASALAQSAYLRDSEIIAAFDESPGSPVGAATLRSLTLSQSSHGW